MDVGFRKRWINLVHRVATGTKKTRTLLTPIGVIIFGVFTALFVAAAIFVDTNIRGVRILSLRYSAVWQSKIMKSPALLAKVSNYFQKERPAAYTLQASRFYEIRRPKGFCEPSEIRI